MTFLVALRHDRIEAPWFLEGQPTGESFRLCVEKVLLTTLHPGDIVVMDNPGSHRKQNRASAHSLSRRQTLLPAQILP